MFLGVLGSLYARGEDGGIVPLGGPVRRQLLAALVARVGQAVPAMTLVEDVWGEAAPASAAKTLQSHVVRLRRDLSAAAEDGAAAIVTEGAGYRLAIPPDSVDAWCFERDLRLGSQQLTAHEPGKALERLETAVAWWRGDAYAEFPDAGFAAAERLRLGELRSVAYERRIDARLALGEDDALVGEIEARLAEEPFRERLWQQLLLALYRSGRQADALTAYQRARSRLADELGVDPGPALRDLESRILAQDASLLVPRQREGTGEVAGAPPPAGRTPLCPYRGLSAFGEADAALFVAREALTARLVASLADTDLVVLSGPSGSGKSSLVRAGLLPALRHGALPGSVRWSCAVAMVEAVGRARARDLQLLVVDSAEELFTLPDAPPLAQVDAAVADLLKRGTRVLLVLRGDFYGRLGELPTLGRRIGAATLLVPPLTELELRRVVVEPARRVGLDVAPDLVDEVLSDVRGQPGALPLLSAALAATWRNREGELLTLGGYRAAGGVRRALETTAEATYASLPEPAQADARRLLVRLATHESGRWTRRPLRRQAVEASGLVDAATLEALAGQRLLTVSDERVELVHEALLDSWPRLHAWLREREIRAEVADAVAGAASAWEGAGRPESDLYRGLRLQAALEWRDAEPQDLLPVEREFLEASEAATHAELAAAEERARREAEGRRRLRRLTAVLAVLAVVATAGGVVATRERSSAQASALAADARRVAALSLTAPDLRTSLLLAAAAYRLQDSPDSRSALLAALERNDVAAWRMPTVGRAEESAASADGRWLWTVDEDRMIHRYDTRTRKQVASFEARASSVATASPDGRQLVVVGPSNPHDVPGIGRVSVIDATDGHLLHVLPVGTDNSELASTQVAYTGDGRWLAVVQGHFVRRPNGFPDSAAVSDVEVFDAHDLTRPARRLALSAPVAEIAASRAALAVLTYRGDLDLVRASDLAVVRSARRAELARRRHFAGFDSPWPYTGSGSPPLVLSADGSRLALTLPGRPTVPYLVDTGHLNAPLRALDVVGDAVTALTFSPRGDELAVGGQDGGLDVIRVPDATIVQRQVTSQPHQADQVMWTRGGLYATGVGGQVLAVALGVGAHLLSPTGPGFPSPQAVGRVGPHLAVVAQSVPGQMGQNLRVVDTRTARLSLNLALPIPGGSAPQYVTVDDAADRAVLTVDDGSGTFDASTIALPSGRVLAGYQPTSAQGDYSGVLAHDGRTAAWMVGDHRLAVLEMPGGRALRTFDVRLTLPGGARHKVLTSTLSPDDSRLLVAGWDPRLHRQSAPGQPDPAEFAGAPAAQLAALVDLHSGRVLGQLGDMGPTAYLDAGAWSPDGNRILIGTDDGTIRLLDGHTLHPLTAVVPAVADWVTSADWSPDGSTVVVAGRDGEIGFFDGRTLRRIGTPLRTSRADWTWAYYRPDGDVIAVVPGPQAGTVQLATVAARPAEWVGAACRLAGDTLTRSEWDRYVGASHAYRSPC